MKRIGLLKTLAVVTAIIGSGLALNQTTAQAKGFTWLKTKDYSANPPLYAANTPGQSVTMWNWNHTKKLHNLRNYPRTQWSVVQSVKMYNPKKMRGNKTGIYYKLVKGNKYGYVHRNFVNRVTQNSGTGTVTPSPKPSNDLNNLPKVDPKLIDEKLNQELISLFPGAVRDTKLQKLAEQWAVMPGLTSTPGNTSPFTQKLIDNLGNKKESSMQMFWADAHPAGWAGGSALENNLYSGKITFSQYIDSYAKSVKFDTSKFAGWSIGAYAYPDTNNNYSSFVVLLLPNN
ncbi:hypothetical protein [Secundilactobacillus kimchicus]|uniref:hypothetical protein n=1 Tax=Secundilactobacillus kimchicus TaxID=528209 RepID=UPI0024A866B2|nr:hypothetical protein [Secundilactobacillus kimchicus]